MLLECITDAITTPVTAGSRGVRAVAWAELGVLLLSIVALAVSARNLLLAGSQLALTRGGWSDLWRCFCTLTERRSLFRRTTIDGRGCVSSAAAGRRNHQGCLQILRTRRRTSGNVERTRLLLGWHHLRAEHHRERLRLGLRTADQHHQRKNSNQDSTGHSDLLMERFTTAVSRSWQSATAFINVAPTKLTV